MAYAIGCKKNREIPKTGYATKALPSHNWNLLKIMYCIRQDLKIRIVLEKVTLNIAWTAIIISNYIIKLSYLDSHYVYLNSYEQSKAFANAILISPLILTSIEKVYCIKFFYHMYAFPEDKNDVPIIGTLSLKLRVN